jgi:hypothetical protein
MAAEMAVVCVRRTSLAIMSDMLHQYWVGNIPKRLILRPWVSVPNRPILPILMNLSDVLEVLVIILLVLGRDRLRPIGLGRV